MCDLVAHHSGSRFVAGFRGLAEALAEFAYHETPVADALTIADQTVGPNGKSLSLDERMRDMLERHGPGSASARAHPERELYFRAAFQRVSRRLRYAGVRRNEWPDLATALLQGLPQSTAHWDEPPS